MKIAVVSDSHDNIPNIQKFIAWANANYIEMIIHCGDIAAPDSLKEVADNFAGQVHAVFGNVADREGLEEIKREKGNVVLHGERGMVEADGAEIGFCHFPDEGKIMAGSGEYAIVFYGHTHKPWEEKIGDCRLVNPGTLAGMFNKATFAIYDSKTGDLKLKILEFI